MPKTITFGAHALPLWPGYQPQADEKPPEAPHDWRRWLKALFPQFVRDGFAQRHIVYWDWLWEIEREDDPRPFVAIWSRGGAKSTSAELGAVALGIRNKRRYGLYVRSTQERADDSVQNIGFMLESTPVAHYYPEHGQRLLGKFGDPKGWRRNRLRTRGGLTIDALGLDTASRGVKVEDQRPDFIIFDDIDERHDSPHATEKKLATIRESILPAGTPNAAVIGIQNLIIPHGVFAKLADGSAGFLTRRILSGPEPAILDLKITREIDAESGVMRAVIKSGRPTWEGQNLKASQALMDRIGFPAFDRECQHNVHDREGALWTRGIIERGRVGRRQESYKRIAIGVDPSGGGTEIGIVADALRYDGHVDTLADRSQKGALGPRNWANAAVELYHELEADVIVAEANFGGDMVKSTIHTVDPDVPVRMVHASRGKNVRAEPVSSLYGDDRPGQEVRGIVHHVGHFPELESEMTGWVPGDPDSPNRLDAHVWAVTEVKLGHKRKEHDFTTTPAIRT